jgi:hypothetical protein
MKIFETIDKTLNAAKRFQWNMKLRGAIWDSVHEHAFGNSCEVVQNEVLEQKLKFNISPLLMGLMGARSGIPVKIRTLDMLASAVPEKVQKLTAEQAQDAANRSTGNYLVLALMWDKLNNGIEKHHVAFVIAGKYDKVDGPAIGGGGMTPEQIKKGWILSNGRIHFTDWQNAKYYTYGYKSV